MILSQSMPVRVLPSILLHWSRQVSGAMASREYLWQSQGTRVYPARLIPHSPPWLLACQTPSTFHSLVQPSAFLPYCLLLFLLPLLRDLHLPHGWVACALRSFLAVLTTPNAWNDLACQVVPPPWPVPPTRLSVL